MKIFYILILTLIISGCSGSKLTNRQVSSNEHTSINISRNYNLQDDNKYKSVLPSLKKSTTTAARKIKAEENNPENNPPKADDINSSNKNKTPIIVPIMSFVIIIGLYLYVSKLNKK
ncbi:hypothetical protein CMI47_18300 [Candidatus Pacearchaeota archaeon]|jgi:hypothetical protein|nr:hypothetical protein [Candidatus Pacearchaeota archaeon]|tara:strand:- start:2168 stop:2518 length:351 start_codon:yes stop_codon:yes gene_type:complete